MNGGRRYIEPFEIEFDSDEERDKFVEWANNKSKNCNANKKKMIQEMKRLRSVRNQNG